MSGRAERIHHNERIKKKVKRRLQRRWQQYRDVDDRAVGKATSTHLVDCSCPMCGNPRKWFGKKTKQEIQAEEMY